MNKIKNKNNTKIEIYMLENSICDKVNRKHSKIFKDKYFIIVFFDSISL